MEEEKDDGGSSRGTADTAEESEQTEGLEDEKVEEDKTDDDPLNDGASKTERDGQCYW